MCIARALWKWTDLFYTTIHDSVENLRHLYSVFSKWIYYYKCKYSVQFPHSKYNVRHESVTIWNSVFHDIFRKLNEKVFRLRCLNHRKRDYKFSEKLCATMNSYRDKLSNFSFLNAQNIPNFVHVYCYTSQKRGPLFSFLKGKKGRNLLKSWNKNMLGVYDGFFNIGCTMLYYSVNSQLVYSKILALLHLRYIVGNNNESLNKNCFARSWGSFFLWLIMGEENAFRNISLE